MTDSFLPQEFYRVLHIASIIFFFAGIGGSFLSTNNLKVNKIVTGIASLLIFVAGMGLILTALGIHHGEKWPGFLHAKITIWALVSIGGPILAKRLKKGRLIAFYGILLLGVMAAYLAIYKPF